MIDNEIELDDAVVKMKACKAKWKSARKEREIKEREAFDNEFDIHAVELDRWHSKTANLL